MESQQPFSLGRVVSTPGALESIGQHMLAGLARHARADWGDVDAEDKQANDDAMKNGGRLLSVYKHGETKYWIITEADRSVTTVLLPDEY